MFTVKWYDLETRKHHKREFDNYEDKLEFVATELFAQELLGKIIRTN